MCFPLFVPTRTKAHIASFLEPKPTWVGLIASQVELFVSPPPLEGHKFNRTLAGCVKWVSDMKLSASMLDKRAHFSSANLINILTATLVSEATGQ